MDNSGYVDDGVAAKVRHGSPGPILNESDDMTDKASEDIPLEVTPIVELLGSCYGGGGEGDERNAEKPKEEDTVHMKRQIGLIGGISMIVGTMIGSGIFITPTGLLKRTDSVAVSMIVWVSCGLLTTFTALSYCELGTVVPRSGGEHAYYMAAFAPLHPFWGELPAFLFAWMTVTLLKPSSLAIISMTFGQYTMQPILNSMGVAKDFRETAEYETAQKILAAVCALFIAFVNIYSAKFATRVQIFFTGTKITAMVVLIGVGIYNVSRGQYGGIPMEFDTSSATYGDIAMAFYSGLWAYEGWNNLNFVTEELINPAKNLPLAIIIGIPLTTVLYLLINIAYLSALEKDVLIDSQAVAVDVGDLALGQAKFIIPLLVALSTIGSANGSQFTAGRICYVASRDGHLVDVLSYVHAKRLTPAIAIMLNTGLALIMIAARNITELIDFFSFIAWIFYGLALVSHIVLRVTHPDAKRPIRIPRVVSIVGIIVSIYLVLAPLIDQPKVEYLFVLAFTLLGVLLYYPFVYKKVQVGFMDKITRLIQYLTVVAPSPYKAD